MPNVSGYKGTHARTMFEFVKEGNLDAVKEMVKKHGPTCLQVKYGNRFLKEYAEDCGYEEIVKFIEESLASMEAGDCQ